MLLMCQALLDVAESCCAQGSDFFPKEFFAGDDVEFWIPQGLISLPLLPRGFRLQMH